MKYDDSVRVVGWVGLVALALLSACAGGADFGDALPDPGSDGDSGSPSGEGMEQLSQPTTFTIADTAEGSGARLVAVALGDEVTETVELSVVGGTLTLSRDGEGRIRFHDLFMDAADVLVAPSVVPPDGLTLTDLSLDLAAPSVVQSGSSSAEQIGASAELSIDVRWAVVLDHGTVMLAPIRLPALTTEITVEADESGQLEARLTATHPGAFWSWAGIFELRELEMDLVAATEL
jgi:hypothetical protein